MSTTCSECCVDHDWRATRTEARNALDRLVRAATEAFDAGVTVDDLALAIHIADVATEAPR